MSATGAGDSVEILQQLRDSGINAELSSFCDDGWRWHVGGNGIALEGDAPHRRSGDPGVGEDSRSAFPGQPICGLVARMAALTNASGHATVGSP